MPDNNQKQDRMWAMFCHLSALLAYVGLLSNIPVGLTLTHFWGPLIIWLVKRNDFAFVDKHGKSALNFQLTFSFYGIVVWLLTFLYIGIPLMYVLAISWFILIIIASIKASNGEDYQYPLTIRFLQ